MSSATLSAILGNLALDLFDVVDVVGQLDNVVCGNDGGSAAPETVSEDSLSEELLHALQTLKSAPLIRAAGPTLYSVVKDWLGACDENTLKLLEHPIDELSIVLYNYINQVPEKIEADAKYSVLADFSAQWQQYSPSSSAWRALNAIIFTCLALQDICGWPKRSSAKLYWYWLALLFADNFTSRSQASESALRALTSQAVVSLILPMRPGEGKLLQDRDLSLSAFSRGKLHVDIYQRL